ncbi:BglG family transcription antiterminator [Bacillus thuringiensis]|uniref:Helix-turn-helix domain-containing protein n=1 Tax=Bacillus thuringiensis serovar andalousiensis TaxID=257985 RepID=A0A6H0TQI8_BACTU|nr:helix-turn-helix domain-containing protein [Bacillus thuringiensis]QIW21914.1 helix-turn-helix domain-containing protein [Bacillus thuringiensis serovar andalousiensis]
MERDINRQIGILRILSEENIWFTILELEQKLGCSSKTIRKDISIINDVLSPNSSICSIKGQGVRLFLAPDQSIAEVISKFFKRSLTFLTFQQLLEQNFSTVSSLADKLYIPLSSMNKVLSRVEAHIEKFGLSLAKRPLRIVGNEVQILVMFSDLYLEAFVGEEWPFTEYKKEVFERYLSYIEEKLNITLFISDRRRLIFFMAIFLKRKEQGYSFKLDKEMIDCNVASLYYVKIFKNSENISFEEEILQTVEEKVLFIIALKIARYKMNNHEKSKQEELMHYKEGKIHSYLPIVHFIQLLEQEVGVKLKDNDEFIYGMIDYCRRLFYKLRFMPYLKRPNRSTTNYIKEKYNSTFCLVEKAFNQWGETLYINPIPEEEIAKVTMRIIAKQVENHIEHKRALLITDEGSSWKSYMKSVLIRKFGKKLKIEDEVYGADLEESVQLMDIDFVVTTVPLHIESKPLICVSTILQERDLKEIEAVLH